MCYEFGGLTHGGVYFWNFTVLYIQYICLVYTSLLICEGFKISQKTDIPNCLHLLTFFVMVLQIGASFNQTNVSLWVVDLGVCIIH